MRRAANVDGNHAEIVSVLRASGCRVQSMAGVGNGVPDLLVWSPFQCRFVVLEVKDGSKPPSARQLTPAQQKWWADWSAARGAMQVVTNAVEALTSVGAKGGER